ncbi:hypothetical protein COT44_03465 [Candidatus Shapirobacteria bacterium CG08_land_8_20_14_0_20_39_18]|uniref:Uncharacterized protein n=1 Tax=Candidatus Shapirobacteria bacterium CG08_land_8_20_14_0_20_39_18 TaxID=1974883 RepID=A0A2M6XCX6_9BACT|nr:MAG: hypothetical protein COT44_03465 [Candidatus Shapirobacteria bacterium CG08_land_8_20_14_0_20_39_18]PIY65119.1 MAG: hypothetical protein COY91_03575 [Candidatus Shapirobacteria bacterium CG_4_10_14_0_8_um_filter_39_15]PJE68303.1 MAG: hypothetical protein COU94_02640 [Candidatus Shapirobacteria bacterium CG10_big_fil_rev_8_21_14_0_10_38_8]
MAIWEDPKCTIGGVATLQGFECIFKIILNIAAQLGVLLLFILLIMGGFKYMTSGGDPKASASASQTITYAIFGLVMLVIIWLIMKFIWQFTGVDVLNFSIPSS